MTSKTPNEPDAPVVANAEVTTDARVSRRKPAEDAAASTTPPDAAASDASPRRRKAAPDPTVEETPSGAKRPRKPSFGMSEGTRDELARTGRATDPFTGELLTDEDRLAEVRKEAKARGESVPREA